VVGERRGLYAGRCGRRYTGGGARYCHPNVIGVVSERKEAYAGRVATAATREGGCSGDAELASVKKC